MERLVFGNLDGQSRARAPIVKWPPSPQENALGRRIA